jgi:hypothetical protein
MESNSTKGRVMDDEKFSNVNKGIAVAIFTTVMMVWIWMAAFLLKASWDMVKAMIRFWKDH